MVLGPTRTDSVGTRNLSREENYRSVMFATDLHLVPRLRLSGAVPVKPLCTFMEWSCVCKALIYFHGVDLCL